MTVSNRKTPAVLHWHYTANVYTIHL